MATWQSHLPVQGNHHVLVEVFLPWGPGPPSQPHSKSWGWEAKVLHVGWGGTVTGAHVFG